MNSIKQKIKNTRALGIVSCFVAITLLAGCASRSKPPENITQVMLLPVAPVEKLYTENKGVPLGVLWQSLADRQKSKVFTESMEATRNSMALALSAALLKELKARGFDAQMLEGVARPPASPDDIDYTKLPTAHPVLHVYFEAVGMYSSRFSLDYIPRVNVTANLVRAGEKKYLYSDTIYYGADSRGETPTSIPADPRYKWASFDALTGQPKDVSDAYTAAVAAIASKIASNLRPASSVSPK
ncbi:hypothetical protein [Polaromonas sp.]|uniref:hypothetical protein n=1 Tax=Polaromonas sp. TaxID=1869339 RepID=UPI0025CF7E8A|nr:hypothetical protein [Polaromonas sp.]